jgi:4-carboxymuconolactone decarboxylase
MPRLPEIFKREELPEDKQWVHDYLIKTRGKISNGYAPYLQRPEFVARIAQLGTYIRFESSLPQDAYELLALTASSECDNPYEADNHALITAKMGIPQSTVDAARNKTALKEVSENDELYIRCAREMMREHRLSDASFEAARKRLGDNGVVDLIATIGYYAMLACVHNGMQVRGPA